MAQDAPQALQIVARLRARFLREFSASLPRTPLVASAQRFEGPQPRDPAYDTTSTALYVALRGATAAQIQGIKQDDQTAVTRLFHRALQVYAKAASQRLFVACQRWRHRVYQALINHPADARALITHLRDDHNLIITTTRDGELSIDMRAPSQTPLGNPGIIYSRPLQEHAAFEGTCEDAADALAARLDEAIRAAEQARDSQNSRSRATPREIGETRVLSELYRVLAPEVTDSCYRNLLKLAATELGIAEDLGRIRVRVLAEQAISHQDLFGSDDALPYPLDTAAADAPEGARTEWLLYDGYDPVAAESCYLWHAARSHTPQAARLLIDSQQPLRVADAELTLSSPALQENNPARQAQLWAFERTEQAPITPAQFLAALRLAFPGQKDTERFRSYAAIYPGKPEAVRLWATRDGSAHVPRDSFNLLLIRAGLHREFCRRRTEPTAGPGI